MDRDSNFFWLCIRDAAAGTRHLASAIATVVCGGILWVAAWLGGVKSEALTSLVGPIGFDVLLAIASLLASWIAVFLLRLGGAPARLYRSGQKKIKDLEKEILESNERLVPKINVVLNPLTGGVHEYPTEVAQPNSPPIKGPSSKWVQFGVSCASVAPLTGCEAFLTSVTRIDGDNKGPELVEEHTHCNWSQIEDRKITIHPLITQNVNLFSLYDNPLHVRPETSPIKIRLHDAVQNPGRYRIEVVVTADNSTPKAATFDFEWHDFNDVRLN